MAHNNSDGIDAGGKIKKRYFFVCTVAVLIFSLFYIKAHAPEFRRLAEISPQNLAVFFSLQCISIFLNGCLLLLALRVFGSRLTFMESFGLTVINIFLNYLPFKAGNWLKAYYLKKVHSLRYASFITATGILVVINFFIAGITGISILVMIYLRNRLVSVPLFAFFLLSALGSLFLLKVPTGKILKYEKHPIFSRLGYIMASRDTIYRNKRLLGALFFLTLGVNVLYALRLSYGFTILYGDVSFLVCLLLSINGILFGILSVTPGSIGIREAAVGITSSLLGARSVDAVVVTTLDRGVSLILLFFLGIFFLIFFLVRMRRYTSPKNQ